jgi:NAD-dependent DNA ligase
MSKTDDYKKLNKKELIDLLIKSDNQYYNIGEPLFDDNTYDELKEHLRVLDKKNAYFKRIGADVDNKVKLPYFLGSQDKIKDDVKVLDKWIKKYNNPKSYIISEKLDGISCLIEINNNTINIYTRGNGIYGQNITHIKDYIKGIPNYKDKNFNITVRGELIISKKNWDKIKDKGGSNARNVVAGAINSKIIQKDILKLIDFIVYDVIEPRNTLLHSLQYALSLKFKVVNYIHENIELNIKSLYELFKSWKEKSKYDIDGLVVTHNDIYKLKSGENPKYSFAFKSLQMQKEMEVIVNDIEWNVSKDKYLKPVVKFNEINLNGVKIKQATGFNADYIFKNVIGVGSRIIIIRSGDVIPHIKEVISPSTNGKPLMPDVKFIWNKKDIILEDDTKNREQDIKTFTSFMKSLNIKGIAEGVITKLYDNSYDTLYKIINITKKELLDIDGFKEKSAENIINALKDIKTKSCLELMAASNLLGRGLGEKKLNLLIEKHPYICIDQEKTLKLTIDDLKSINGFGELTAKLIIKNIKLFIDFYNSLNIVNKDIIKDNENKDIEPIKNDKYLNNSYVFSGIRNKELEKQIIANGGKVLSTVNKKTTCLIVKNIDDDTAKVKNALLYKIPIITYDDFIK